MARQFEQLLAIQPVVIKQLQTMNEKNRLAHAYIFDGEKGTGKRDTVHFFMKLLLCEQPTQNVPCETCRNCRRIDSGNHPNVREIEPDGATIKVDQIRDLLAQMTRTGVEQGRKIYVLYDAEKLNASSANTLLKFLEEPDGDVMAILVTAQIQALLPTIRSRCQYVKFSKIPHTELVKQLEQQGCTKSMASTVSMMTNELETAIILTNDEQFVHARKTVLKLVDVVRRNVQEALILVHNEWLPHIKEKQEMEQALDLLLYAYRDIVSVKANPDAACTFPDMKSLWQDIALHTTFERLSEQMQAVLQARANLQRNMNRTLLMEQLMLNLQEGYTFV